MRLGRVRLTIEGRVARLTLATGGAAAAFDGRLLRELSDAFETIGSSDEVTVSLLVADGQDFFLPWGSDLAEESSQRMVAGLEQLADLPGVLVAALQGTVGGALLDLALAADIRVAAADARFVLPADGRLQQVLALLAGKRGLPASQGEQIDAHQAYRAGLVSRLAEPGEARGAAEALAARIASHGPIAVRYAKEAVRRGLELTLTQGLRLETDLATILQTTEERAEGVRAFLEKRPPRFQGR